MANPTPETKQTQLPPDPRERPRYSKEQLQTYFRRIRLPEKYNGCPLVSDSSLAKTMAHGLPFVQALTRYHAAAVPFENLELHYSVHKKISLNMDDLFAKFADQGLKYGRGGRCMENNGFFGTVLRSLGFDVRNCAGRVSRMMSPNSETRERQGDTYDGWNHMLNIICLDGEWWVVDVGMGAMGPNIPFPLRDGYESVSIAPRKIRLQWRSIPEHYASSDGEAQKLWCYDVCHHPHEETPTENKWIPAYCFTSTEFLPQDYEMMSWFTSTSPKSFFTYVVLCTKMLLSEDEEKIIGDVTMVGDTIRRTIGGRREVLKVLKSEEDRLNALREIFEVGLTTEERDGIRLEMQVMSVT
ncbi:hypothetical protein M433DRAFT_7246 [Acidomyces richmondensis BFW]|nr:hypothetical protein M433DRAFT_7246 [Acidomyces richmondensis BFW]